MRKKSTAADSWEDDAIPKDRALELYDVLSAHSDYEVRLSIQCKHDDSAIVKTIDTESHANSTLANLRYAVMFNEYPFEQLTDTQIRLLSGHEFAADSREEVPTHNLPPAPASPDRIGMVCASQFDTEFEEGDYVEVVYDGSGMVVKHRLGAEDGPVYLEENEALARREVFINDREP